MKATIHDYLDQIEVVDEGWHAISTIDMSPNSVIFAKIDLCGWTPAGNSFTQRLIVTASMDSTVEINSVNTERTWMPDPVEVEVDTSFGNVTFHDKIFVKIKGKVKCASSINVLETKK